MAKAQPAPVVLRIDRSKRLSTVHGDRGPDDPMAPVHYMQDGLPYDANGQLVPDDGKNAPWDAIVDGHRVKHYPLYTDAMREKVKRKMERIAKGLPKDDVVETDDESVKEDASEDVNLESWLRGEVQYEPFLIYAACKRRFSKNYTKLRDVVDDLVLEERLVPEDQVTPNLLRLIGLKA